MKPTIGRIVIFCVEGLELAAIITCVHTDERVDLTVFPPPWCKAFIADAEDRTPGAAVSVSGVMFGTGPFSTFWKWPPRA